MCDRTQEFIHLIDRLPKPDSSTPKAPRKNAEKSKAKSEFHEAASDISKGISRTNGLLAKLVKLVRRQGLFDDPTSEINNLVVHIKQDLDALNSKCDSAQQFVDSRKRQLGERNQSINHSAKVVAQLKTDLMNATKDFKTILETRSIKMKDQQQKKVQLTGIGTLSPLRQFAASAAQAQAAQLQNSSVGFPKSPYSQLPTEDSSSTLTTTGSMPVQLQYQQQQLLVAPPATHQYYEQREQAVTEVEKTIGELGTLFKRLATMISEQQELVERIDEDVENAISNTNLAHEALLKTYEKVSSNRGLYMKLMAIITLFIIFFVLFMM